MELSDESRVCLNAESAAQSGMFRKRVPVYAYRYDGSEPLLIRTLEGDMTAMPGDWIITGIRGETYACKPDIFEATYERVEP
jgi:hypothetical protein